MSIKGSIEIGNRNAKKASKKTLEAVSENVKAMYKEMAENNQPYNGATKRAYSGDNTFRLIVAMKQKGFTDPRWYSWGQIHKMGARVKKGEHGTEILGWWEEDKDDTDEIEGRKTIKPHICYLFNAEQCTGINAAATEKTEKKETAKAPAARFPIIRGSFEIKAKTAKKPEKAEAKKEVNGENLKMPANISDEARKNWERCKRAINAIKTYKKAAEAWEGKVLNVKFWEAMKKALAPEYGEKYRFYAGANHYGALHMEMNSKEIGGECITIFHTYRASDFTTQEAGKMPRINYELFAKIADNRIKDYTDQLKAMVNICEKEEELKALSEKAREIKSEFLKYYEPDLKRQGITIPF